MKNNNKQQSGKQHGRWVTAAQYATLHSLSPQTLANWRYRDRLAGREGPGPGHPLYRRYGGAVRYWLPASERLEAA